MAFTLMRVKEESEKTSLKLNNENTIMASAPITSWQVDGDKWKKWYISFYCAPKTQ